MNVFKRGLLRAVAIAIPVTAVVLPMAASASPSGTVKAVTHTSNHPDTTSVSGPCTGTSDNGPVWAYDNLSLQYSAVSDGTNTYSVTITAHGSFAAISDPITGACSTGSGSVDGTINYEVSSTTAPDPANLPSQEPGDLGQVAILNQLFGGTATIIGGGHYSYTYNPVDGQKYTQVG
jgi:hypothetical protein